MKTNVTKLSIALSCVIAACAFFALSGCASMEATNQESLLSAAGFRERTPETPKQKELYASAEPYKVLHASVNGRVFYAYKDEKKGVAYIGGEAEYARYKELAIRQQIALDNYMAAEMNRDSALGWYGAYGFRRGLWW